MAWPKGKPRPGAFKKKMAEVAEEVVCEVEADYPVPQKLSDIIAELKAVLVSYRHDIEVKVVERANVTTEISVLITFAVR